MKPAIREIALTLKVKPRTIQKWKERGGVPFKWQRRVREAAKAAGKRLVWSDMEWPRRDAA